MLSSNFQQQNVHEWGSNKNVLSAAIEALNPKKYQIYMKLKDHIIFHTAGLMKTIPLVYTLL